MKRLHLSLYVRLKLLFALLLLSIMALPSAMAQNADQANIPTDKLLQAVQNGDVAAVKALLDQGVNPNTPNSQKWPPLDAINQALQDPVEITRLLIEKGADVNAKDANGETPLLSAVAGEDDSAFEGSPSAQAAIVSLLLDHGADPNIKNREGTLIDMAMLEGHLPVVALLYKRHIPLAPDNPYKETPLHYAAYAGDAVGVEALLKAGSAVNTADMFHRTPLVLAVEAHASECVHLLLAAGADPNSSELLERTLLVNTIDNGDLDMAFDLLHSGAEVNPKPLADFPNSMPETPLIAALTTSGMPSEKTSATEAEMKTYLSQKDKLIKEILDRGADVNQSDGTLTPLGTAVEGGGNDWVKVLLDKGARINAPSRDGKNVLFLTFYNQSDQSHALILQTLLIDRGADINAVDPEGIPFLIEVVKESNVALTNLLLAKGAKVNVSDTAHKTPLMWAAYQGQLGIVQSLIAHGADVNARDVLGQTALFLATKAKHAQVVQYLLSHGAMLPKAATVQRNALGQPMVLLPIHWSQGVPPAHGRLSLTIRKSANPNQASRYTVRQGSTVLPPISFAPLFTDHSLWTSDENNDHSYQINRGYFDASAYGMGAMVLIGNDLYTCLDWYAPGASDHHLVAILVIKIAFEPAGARLTVIRKENPSSNSQWPFIAPDARKLIFDNGRFRYQYAPATGKWKRVSRTPGVLKSQSAAAWHIGPNEE